MSSGSITLAHQDPETTDQLHASFYRQHQAFMREGSPSYPQRRAKLDRLEKLIQGEWHLIVDAVIEDFGEHSFHEAVHTEIFATLSYLRYAKKNLKRWMRPRKWPLGRGLTPAKARVKHQPKGVIGMIAHWNSPFYQTAVPLIAALAAGNRVMLKPSELTPKTTTVMKQLFASIFDPTCVHVSLGDATATKRFSSLAFDHLWFSGHSQAASLVVAAAAQNLTPVTLELGGKSPVILHPDYPIREASRLIVEAKSFNAGQSRVTPDYLLAAEENVPALVEAMRAEAAWRYTAVYHNPDYTSIVNRQHFERLQNYLADARQKGADIIELSSPQCQRPAGSHKIPLTLVLNANDDMTIMQEEIFGPLLPVVSYRSLDEAIRYVNARPRPVALYYFDQDLSRAERVSRQTASGHACVNGALMHMTADKIPLAGMAHRSLGFRHDKQGFETFSHTQDHLTNKPFNQFSSLNVNEWSLF